MSNFQEHLSILTESSISIEKLWELKHFSPNDEQREAILHLDGPLYITAGPGSGKTRVLLWRAVNLIVKIGDVTLARQIDDCHLSAFLAEHATQQQHRWP